jgi:hypothetical protein
MSGLFSISKSVNLIYHISKIRELKLTIISIDVEKDLTKFIILS